MKKLSEVMNEATEGAPINVDNIWMMAQHMSRGAIASVLRKELDRIEPKVPALKAAWSVIQGMGGQREEKAYAEFAAAHASTEMLKATMRALSKISL